MGVHPISAYGLGSLQLATSRSCRRPVAPRETINGLGIPFRWLTCMSYAPVLISELSQTRFLKQCQDRWHSPVPPSSFKTALKGLSQGPFVRLRLAEECLRP